MTMMIDPTRELGSDPYGALAQPPDWLPPPDYDSPADAISEATLAQCVNDIAKHYQWRKYHTRDSRRSDKGFPDLVLVRGKRVIWAELKTMDGRITPEQREWLNDLTHAGQEVYVWRPDGLRRPNPYIYRILKGE